MSDIIIRKALTFLRTRGDVEKVTKHHPNHQHNFLLSDESFLMTFVENVKKTEIKEKLHFLSL